MSLSTPRNRLRALQQKLAVRLWVAPIVGVLIAAGGAIGLSHLDRLMKRERSQAWFLFGGGADSARELLSTIAASLLTITGLICSITILVLQLASSQFSPRVLRTFLEDRSTRYSLAVFVGGFVYALVLLSRIRSENEYGDAFVPALAVFVAFMLAVLSVGVLMHYIDNMAQSIRAVHVIARVGDETRRCLDRMYPESAPPERIGRTPDARPHPDKRVLHGGAPGVVTSVDDAGLLELAREKMVVIGVSARVGQFVPYQAPLFAIWGRTDLDWPQLKRYVTIGRERTLEQDTAFGFRQLVDIAERALSPAVNDPTTAVQALDQIHDLLRRLITRRLPAPEVYDESGRLRLVLPRWDWDDYVRLGCEEILEYGRGSFQLRRRVASMIEDLSTISPEARRAALQRVRIDAC